MTIRHLASAARALALAGLLASSLIPGARAAERFFAYNMTTNTVFEGVYLAPSGTQKWGRNQALNDKDKVLDTSERLALTGISHGTYDVKLVAKGGRTCIKRGVDLSHDTTFEIREDDLAACR